MTRSTGTFCGDGWCWQAFGADSRTNFPHGCSSWGGDGIGCFPQISQICADLGSGDGWPQKGAKGANGEGKALEYVFTNGVYFEYARLVWALLLRH